MSESFSVGYGKITPQPRPSSAFAMQGPGDSPDFCVCDL